MGLLFGRASHRRTVGSAAAADTAGVSVRRVRFFAVVVGGALAGLAGSYFSLAYRPAWGENITNGLGWIALGLAILALWHPLRAVPAALLFGAFFTLSFRLQGVFPPELLTVLPYLVTVLALTLIALRGGRGAVAPRSDGVPPGEAESWRPGAAGSVGEVNTRLTLDTVTGDESPAGSTGGRMRHIRRVAILALLILTSSAFAQRDDIKAC